MNTITGRLICAALIAAAIFAACTDEVTGPADKQAAYGIVRIGIEGDSARTVFPSKNFEYSFSKDGGAAQILQPKSGAFVLEPGSWSVTVSAKDGAASGTAAFALNPGETKDIKITLTVAASSGDGKFSYTVKYPEGADLTISLTKLSDMQPVTLNPGASGTNGKTETITVASGYYLVAATVTLGEKHAGISEAVHVYPNLTTTFEYTFKDTELIRGIPLKTVSISFAAPVNGDTPAATGTSSDTGFTIGNITWSPSPVANKFEGDKVYTATLTLTAASGYTLESLTEAKINGQNATMSGKTSGSVTLSYTFAKTDNKIISSIAVKTQPTKLSYTHGETLALAGLAVTLTYSDNSKADISASDFTAHNITADPANGAVLTAKDNNNQPVTISYGSHTVNTNNLTVNPKNASTLTIESIAAHTYTGSEIKPDVIVKDGTATLTLDTDYTVSYSDNTNAGTATITVTGAGNYTGTKTANFTISKASPTITTWPTATAIIYGAALSTSTLSGEVNTTPGTFAWTAPTTIPTVTNSGYGVTFTPTDTANYNTATGTVSITVSKANPTITWPTATGITYGAALSTSALNATAAVSSTPGTYAWTTGTTIPTVTNSGYSVTFTPTDTANYNTLTNTVSITVNKATPAVGDYDISGAGTFNYDGTAKTVTVSVKTSGTRSPGVVTITYGANGTTAPTNVGSYAVTFNVAGTDNWNAATGLSAGTLTVSKATPVAGDYDISGIGTFTLDGTAKTVTVTVKSSGTRSPGAVSNITYGANGATAPTNIGNYTVTFDVAAADPNWNAASGLSAGTLTINPPTFTTIADFKDWLDAKPTNTAATAYPVKLNVSALGGNYNTNGSLGYMLGNISSKYINLDLSGSTFTSIEDYAFFRCSNLVSITIPASVTTIGEGVFRNCTSLTSITIPNSVTTIGGDAFAGCSGLVSVRFESVGITIMPGSLGTFIDIPNSNSLQSAYTAGGIGTYTKASSGSTWTKQ